jgi:hypothetical protein
MLLAIGVSCRMQLAFIAIRAGGETRPGVSPRKSGRQQRIKLTYMNLEEGHPFGDWTIEPFLDPWVLIVGL